MNGHDPFTSYDFPSVRLEGPAWTVVLYMPYHKSAESKGLFTLHSASGYRTENGITIDKLHGFCHVGRKLRTIWMHRISRIVDALTDVEVRDISDWLNGYVVSTNPSYETEHGYAPRPAENAHRLPH